jgi:hypothetical protein
LRPACVREESEVADADEAARQNVEQEPSHELWSIHGHDAAAVSRASISIAKRYLAVLCANEALMPDGNAVGVPAEIAKHLLWTGHRSFAVDDPFLGRRLPQQWPPQWSSDAGATRLNGALEALEELGAEYPRENSNWHQKAGASGPPMLPAGVKTTARYDAVDVRMKGERLRPCVQHGNGARCSPQPTVTHVMKGTDRGAEEQGVPLATVDQEERM